MTRWKGDDPQQTPYLVTMNAPVPAPSILDSVGIDPARAREILGDALIGADDGEIFVERSDHFLNSVSYDVMILLYLSTGDIFSSAMT